MEQDERSRPRRSAKRKGREGVSRKSVVAPGQPEGNFKLQTELLAEKRRQQREEKEVAQLRHAQQKIIGKKTIEDFAQLKLIRRQSAAERNQSLHCNGKTLNIAMRGKECDNRETKGRSSVVSMESRPLMSARQSRPPLASDSLPQRPQSAKPVLQSQHQHKSILNTKEAELSASTQSKIHSKKKKRKKTTERKSGRLSPSKSAPVLPDRPTPLLPDRPIRKKINIIVNMRNLQLFEEPRLLSSASSSIISREAWGD